MMAAVRLRNAYRNKRLPDDLAGDVMDVIRDLDDVIVNTYNRFFRYGERRTRLAIKFQGEQQPNPDSRVQLSDTRDALGLPQTKLTWKLSELDRKSVDLLVRTVAAELARLDIARTRLDDWTQKSSATLFPSDLRGGVHHTRHDAHVGRPRDRRRRQKLPRPFRGQFVYRRLLGVSHQRLGQPDPDHLRPGRAFGGACKIYPLATPPIGGTSQFWCDRVTLAPGGYFVPGGLDVQ